ncbi:MAG TPA: alpha/beta hydrolase [Polyangia bacterium]
MASDPTPGLETSLQRAGHELHVEHYRARGETRLTLVMVHGYSAHCGLYRHVAAAFASAGMAVTQFDCRGHGRSSGRRGHIVDFDEYVDDLAMIVDWARQQNAGKPWVLLGHSMGGAISLAFVLDKARREKPSRLALAAPWLKLKMKVSAPKRAAANIAARVLPTLTMPNGLTAENLSRNPLVLAGFDKDPLVHHVATAGWFMAALRAQARIRLQAKELHVPTLLLLAGGDRIVANEATLAFAREAGPIVEVRDYPELFHELFLEPEADVVLADISKWLLAGSPEKKTA